MNATELILRTGELVKAAHALLDAIDAKDLERIEAEATHLAFLITFIHERVTDAAAASN